jgi:hypothetical protein
MQTTLGAAAELDVAFVRSGLRGSTVDVANAKEAFERMVALREAELLPGAPRARSSSVVDAERLLSDYRRIKDDRARLEASARSAAAEIDRIETASLAAVKGATDLLALLIDRRQVLGEKRVTGLTSGVEGTCADLRTAVNSTVAHLHSVKATHDADIAVIAEEERTVRTLIVEGAELVAKEHSNASASATSSAGGGGGSGSGATHTCPICFDRESTVVFTPCGHAVCRPCSERILGPPASSSRSPIDRLGTMVRMPDAADPVGMLETNPALFVLRSDEPDKKCPTCRATVGGSVHVFW